MTFLSQADFARKHKVSPKTVVAWKHRGYVIQAPDGKRVDVEATEKMLGTRTGRGGRLKGPAIVDQAAPPASADPDTWSLHEATRRERVAAAKLRELELAREAGLVVPKADVVGVVRAEYTIIKAAFLGLAAKLAHRLAAATTPEQAGGLVDIEVRAILDGLTADGAK